MKKRPTLPVPATLAVLSAVLFGAAHASAQEPQPYAIGATVPADVKLTDIHGHAHAMGDFRGKIVFIHFWSIVCPSEKVAEPKCKELQTEFGEQGVVQIAINANQRELNAAGPTPYADLRDHVEKAGVNFMVAVDPGNKLTDLFGGKSTPHCFVIDKEGVLRYSGALDDDPKGTKGKEAVSYVRAAIESILAGKEVAVKTSQPYG